MAITLVSNSTKTVTGTSISSDAFELIPGNFLVVAFSVYPDVYISPSALSDTAGNSFSSTTGTGSGLVGGRIGISFASNCNGNVNNVVTLTVSSSTTITMQILQYSGGSTGTSLGDVDLVDFTTTNQTSITSTAFSTVKPNELIVCFGATNNDGTFTAGTGFTLRSTNGGKFMVQDKIVNTIQSGVTVSMTSSVTSKWLLKTSSFIQADTTSGFFF